MLRQSVALRACSAACLALLSACGNGPNAENSTGSAALAVHPGGSIVATTPLSARPFGAAIAREKGIVMVTQLDAGTVSSGLLPSSTLPVAIGVGFIPTNVRFSLDEKTAFVTNQFDDNIGIIDVASGSQVSTVSVPMSTFNVAYCRSNKRVYVTGPGTSVYVINPATPLLTDSIATSAVTNGITTDAKCTRIYVSDESNGRVLEINPATNVIVRTFPTGGAPKDLAVSPAGKRLYVADETGFLQVWNIPDGLPVVSVPLTAGAFGLAISPDGAQVYAGMPFGGGVAVLSTATNTIVNTIPTGGRPRKIAFDATGATAIVANEAGWVDYVQ